MPPTGKERPYKPLFEGDSLLEQHFLSSCVPNSQSSKDSPDMFEEESDDTFHYSPPTRRKPILKKVPSSSQPSSSDMWGKFEAYCRSKELLYKYENGSAHGYKIEIKVLGESYWGDKKETLREAKHSAAVKFFNKHPEALEVSGSDVFQSTKSPSKAQQLKKSFAENFDPKVAAAPPGQSRLTADRNSQRESKKPNKFPPCSSLVTTKSKPLSLKGKTKVQLNRNVFDDSLLSVESDSSGKFITSEDEQKDCKNELGRSQSPIINSRSSKQKPSLEASKVMQESQSQARCSRNNSSLKTSAKSKKAGKRYLSSVSDEEPRESLENNMTDENPKIQKKVKWQKSSQTSRSKGKKGFFESIEKDDLPEDQTKKFKFDVDGSQPTLKELLSGKEKAKIGDGREEVENRNIYDFEIPSNEEAKSPEESLKSNKSPSVVVKQLSQSKKTLKIRDLKSKSLKKKGRTDEIEDVVTSNKKNVGGALSNIFDVGEDPDLKEVIHKSEKETKELQKRAQQKTKNKRQRKSIAKMAVFSQSQESLQQLTPPKKKSKLRKSNTKKATKENFQNKIDSYFDKNGKAEAELEADYMPSIDELLKQPEKVGDDGKTMDEILDELDKEIAERKEKHERESAKVQADIAAEKLRQEERRKRLADNAKLRDRLEVEITEEELRKLFANNRVYLEGIWNGNNESARHKAFHQSRRTRHALTYMMITDPFTDGKPELSDFMHFTSAVFRSA